MTTTTKHGADGDATSRPAVFVDRPAAHVVRVTIDRPPVNAIDSHTQRLLTETFTELGDDLGVRAVVLTGAGDHFCAGADLREEQALDRDDVTSFLRGFGEVLAAVSGHRVPIVAAINGAAHGGGLELALACDIRVGSERASFGAAGVNVGLVANFSSLVATIGDARARHLLLTGWTCRAEQASDWGLLTDVVPADALAERAVAVASRIASRAPLSVEATKACLDALPSLPERDADAMQVREFARLFRTDDHREALHAFFERRPGVYHRT